MNPVFIDTSYLLALEIATDQNHSPAKTHWRQIKEALPPFVTTTYVFDEIVTYLNSRGFHGKAVQIGNSLIKSPSVELVGVDEVLFFRGWELFQERQDKKYSLTDCISFVVMRQRGISIVLAFDRHFIQAGFQIIPQEGDYP